MKLRMTRGDWRISLAIAAAGFVVGCAIALAIGSDFAAPMPAIAGVPPGDLLYENVRIPSTSGSTISGWYFPADDAVANIVLLHGVRSNRRGVVNRVPFLHNAGYAVLAIDFQAHGESPGEHITFGYLESRDAKAAVAWMREKLPRKHTAVIGTSMGAAAAVMNGPSLGADAVIIEMMYATLADAVDNRMRDNLGWWGPCFSWVLLVQSYPRLGFRSSDLRPIDHIADLNAPVFVIAGEADTYTVLSESKRVFDAAREPKALWAVPEAKHADMWDFAKSEYERRVLDFLARSLAKQPID